MIKIYKLFKKCRTFMDFLSIAPVMSHRGSFGHVRTLT